MEYAPFNTESITMSQGRYSPNTWHLRNSYTMQYWERALLQRAISVIKITGMPEEWSGAVLDYFNYILYGYGFLSVQYLPKYGLTFQPCTLSGYDIYMQPTKVLVSNPKLNMTFEGTIGKDCAVLKLTPDYYGVFDIIDYYASKLSNLDCSIDTAIKNTRLPYILGGNGKSAVSALKKIMDKVNKGDSAVFYDSRISVDRSTMEATEPFHHVDLKVKDNYILEDLLRDFATIMRDFDTEIGIPTIPYEKKERMVTDEATSKENESVARCTTWINTLNSSAKEVTKVFPELKLHAELAFTQKQKETKEVTTNGS